MMKDWDSWKHSFEAIANAQDPSDVCNPNYVAISAEDINLFELKNNFMYSVFNKTLLDGFQSIIVAQHASTTIAQVVYKWLVQEAIDSTMSALHVQCITEALTTLKISTLMGTMASLVCSCNDKLRELHTLLPAADHYSGAVKHWMLESAVQLIHQLAQVTSLTRILLQVGKHIWTTKSSGIP